MGDFLNGELPKLFARPLYTNKHTQRRPVELTWGDEVNYWTERQCTTRFTPVLCVKVGLWTDSLTSSYRPAFVAVLFIYLFYFFMWTLFIAHQHTKKNDSTACPHHQWILGFVAQGFLKRVLLWREVCGMKVIHRLSKKTCKRTHTHQEKERVWEVIGSMLTAKKTEHFVEGAGGSESNKQEGEKTKQWSIVDESCQELLENSINHRTGSWRCTGSAMTRVISCARLLGPYVTNVPSSQTHVCI